MAIDENKNIYDQVTKTKMLQKNNSSKFNIQTHQRKLNYSLLYDSSKTNKIYSTIF